MGVVYKAWDEELGVAVALKVIRPEITAHPEVGREVERRFKRELLLSREVTHHNVVRIHDLGDIAGIKYISMSFINGRSLAAVLASKGRLPVPQSLKIAKQIAAGLLAAHDAGVVHRDLKPENVMIDAEGCALIMDFGISRSFGRHARSDKAPAAIETPGPAAPTTLKGMSQDGGTAGMTTAGSVMGTLEYMAPEQALAQEVDQRADIYAFGLIFRDMLLGATRTRGTTPLEELNARMRYRPPAPREVDLTIPEAVDAIIRRCLERHPAARYQTSRELIGDLDRLDDAGEPLPEPKRLTRRQVIAAAVVVVTLLTGTWWLARTPPPRGQPPSMSVLVADFDNRANDPVFDGAFEQALSIGIEGASFISAYPRGEALRAVQQFAPGRQLDLERARLLAQREGLKIVLASSIAPVGSGYEIDVRAIDPVPGTELARATVRASGKAAVLEAIARVASEIRGELGDTAPKSGRVSAAETFTASSLDAARNYTLGQQLLESSKYEESIPYYRRALDADPNLGRAYASWAVSAYSLGRKDEAQALYKKAFALIDRMTIREKYRTYGTYFLTIAADYPKAIENYTKLVELFPADRTGHGNLGVAYFYTLNFAKAFEETRKALQLYPASLKLRNNVGLFAMYAGDFPAAAKAAAEVLKADPGYYRAYLPLAIAAALRGDMAAARTAYEKMAAAGKQGKSLAATGLADIALYEGRFADAVSILREGIAYDESIQNASARASKQAALAEAYLGAGQTALAVSTAREAMNAADNDAALVPLARVLVRAGREPDARAIASRMGRELNPHTRAYANVVEGDIAVAARRLPEGVDAYQSAQKIANLWLTSFSLGVAFVEAAHFPNALAELESCQKRRGEATALFLDDKPTLHYLATLPYWIGRAQEGVGLTARAAESYKAFLAVRGTASNDKLIVDARRRLDR